MFSRRLFLSSIGAGAAATALGAPAILRARTLFREYPFRLGVASGDPASDGFVIWTRLAPEPLEPHAGMALAPIEVEWEVASDAGFRTIVKSGTALARPEIGHSVHVEVDGLLSDRPYWYRFTTMGEQSLRGRARTLPMVSARPDAVRFGVAGCQNYEDGYYGAYRHLAGEDVAFVYHYGDFIYEYRQEYEFVGGLPVQPVRRHAYRNLMDVGDYRIAYGQSLMDVDLQAARAMHPFLSSFDDHEVQNNWVSDVDNWALNNDGVNPNPPSAEEFMLRKAAAMQAWYEHMPVRRALLPRGSMIALNREMRWGDLLSVQMLDTRQYRSDQPCQDGFKPACPEVTSASSQVLGREQEAWLARNLEHGAQWNCLAQQVMMMSLDRRRRAEEPQRILNMDSWAGYEAARGRMLSRMAGLGNVVVLTGDEHQNVAGDLVSRDRVVGAEMVVTSISSGGDGADQRAGSDVLRANNPEVKFVNDQRGYALCDVGREAWHTHFQVVDRVTTPTNSLSRRATATLAHGTPGITIS
ncbi:MAG: alkaline phosphatase D family protein [Sphingopyxis sp.]